MEGNFPKSPKRAKINHTTENEKDSTKSTSDGTKKARTRLLSVFASNRAIHDLTNSILESKQRKLQPQPKPPPPQDRNEKSPRCFQVEPNTSTPLLENADADTDKGLRLENGDSDVQVTNSNAINPTVVYAHPRHLCGVNSFQDISRRHIYCDNCYCYVCDTKAEECTKWKDDHCHAHGGDEKWHQERKMRKNTVVLDILTTDDEDGEEDEHDHIGRDEEDDPMQQQKPCNVNTNGDLMTSSIAEGNYSNYQQNAQNVAHEQNSTNSITEYKQKKFRPETARITEVLSYNLRALDISQPIPGHDSRQHHNDNSTNCGGNAATKIVSKMEGDIPQLNLHKSFFVEGIRIGWPFPVIMPPQRQMALHLIKAFKNSRHVVLESPTGTGKSAAILCTALAWQRYNQKITGKRTKIVYCSRTHSQVAQMVSSLRKTPYRPRMAVLGSRERMCIHEDLTSSDRDGRRKNVNITSECRIRVQNTEKFRKKIFNSSTDYYDDANPPELWPGDFEDSSKGNAETGETSDADDTPQPSKTSKTCPHYRQLTAKHTIDRAHADFIPNREQVTCCSIGGEKTKLGTHDIEDLVAFGRQPEVVRGVAIYRSPKAGAAFGLSLAQNEVSPSSQISIREIKVDGAAAVEKSLTKGDVLISCNGKKAVGTKLSEITNIIRNTKDPLQLDVHRGETPPLHNEDAYSSHASCPYYLSRALSKQADLIFAPYNYVLDPGIRQAMEIDLKDSVVVLDEAHNVEDTLRQLGSGTFREFDLCSIVAMLSNYALMVKCSENSINKNKKTKWFQGDDEEEIVHIPDVAHALLVFMDKIALFLDESRKEFERKPGPTGARQAIAEHKRFKTPDSKEFEVYYYGPTGTGICNKPIGCKMFFDKISFGKEDAISITTNLALFQEYITSQMKDASARNILLEKLESFITLFVSAYEYPEHYYISSTMTVNGNFEYAAADDETSTFTRRLGRFQRKPEAKVQYPPPTLAKRHPTQIACSHHMCRDQNGGKIYHGMCCDGSTPKWQGHFVLNLLTPSILMKELTSITRSVVLASGTLAPIPSLCAELNLLPKSPEPPTSSSEESSQSFQSPDRLQITPKPLEANHVVNLQKQLLACAVGHFVDGSPLSIKMANYNRPEFLDKLGDAIATIIEGIPHGGVLVFLPSFSLLRKCIKSWEDNYTIWDRLIQSKGKIIVEPSSTQSEFEEARDEFNNAIRDTGNCILLAVFRGKMSEGVSFNDDYARGVICVGVPFPSFYDRAITAKIKYNNEQRALRGKDLLPGNGWYQQQAYRAIAQAIGRCIRHAADYGTIILLDSRHCENHESRINSLGLCEVHQKLPKWMRHTVRTLRIDMRSSMGRNEILGGWQGLSKEMKRFFCEAKIHGTSVLQRQVEDLKKVQDRDNNSNDLAFDKVSRKWRSQKPVVEHKIRSRETNVNMEGHHVRGVNKCESQTRTKLNRVRKETTNMIPSMISNVNLAEDHDASTKDATASGLTALKNDSSMDIDLNIDNDEATKYPAVSVKASTKERIKSPIKAPFTRFNPYSRTTSNSSRSAPSPILARTGGDLASSTTTPMSLEVEYPSYSQAMSPRPSQASSDIASQSSHRTQDNHLCVICIERDKNILLLPCKHLCLCSKCFHVNNLTECPMCRTKIADHLDVYI